ncbi:MAG: hypothetical protein HY879_19720 [Deltaproteobacteria bacterium]|nr:hypothetical protein [Deltaproteobacteria bacterium]
MGKTFCRRLISRGVLPAFLILGASLCFLIPPGQAQQKIYDDLFSVSFPSEKEGWASGRWGCLVHTADGGKTWVRQKTGVDLTLSSVCFINALEGWAVGEEGIILHTRDGGHIWKRQSSPIDLFHMKVFFINSQVGWIVSEWTHILYTEDGGFTWQIQFRDQDFILKSISFCDPMNGWAVGEYGFIYHTRNGGKTWEKQGGRFGISKTTGDVEGGNYLFDVTAVDPQTAWAVGIDGTVIRTVNGGATWQEVPLRLPRTQLFGVTVQDRNKILIGGNGVFLISLDGGATWKTPRCTPPNIYNWIYGLSRRGKAGFAAVGGGGIIYFSEGDNPLSWKQIAY